MPGAPGAAPGMPGAGQPEDNAAGGGATRQRGSRGGAGAGGAGISDEQRTAMFSRMLEQLPPAQKKEIEKQMGGKKMQDLSADLRNKIFTKLREAAMGSGAPAREGGPGGSKKGGGRPDAPEAGITVGGFTESDREKAKLPVPPEEDSQLDVLLRPGLLADVEIIVEKIPDAIHIPSHAVLERDGRPYVYVQNPLDNHFEERVIKLAKRSESVVVVAEGLKPDEIVALSDPTAKKNDKDEKPAGSSKPGVGMPSGGGVAPAGGKGK